MNVTHPVEELFLIRAEIRALKAREAELRSFFAERSGPSERLGPFHQVLLTRQKRRRFQPDRLPAAILRDPQFWQVTTTPVVKLVRRAPTPECHSFTAPDPALAFFATAGDDPLLEPFH